jgi:hypothetical protein
MFIWSMEINTWSWYLNQVTIQTENLQLKMKSANETI